jgi:hypothetical protein
VGQHNDSSFEEFFAATYSRLVGLLFAFLHDQAQAEDPSRTPLPARCCAGGPSAATTTPRPGYARSLRLVQSHRCGWR